MKQKKNTLIILKKNTKKKSNVGAPEGQTSGAFKFFTIEINSKIESARTPKAQQFSSGQRAITKLLKSKLRSYEIRRIELQ